MVWERASKCAFAFRDNITHFLWESYKILKNVCALYLFIIFIDV